MAKKTSCELGVTGVKASCKALRQLEEIAGEQALDDLHESVSCRPLFGLFRGPDRNEISMNLPEQLVSAESNCSARGLVDLHGKALDNVSFELENNDVLAALNATYAKQENQGAVLEAMADVYEVAYRKALEDVFNQKARVFGKAVAKVSALFPAESIGDANNAATQLVENEIASQMQLAEVLSLTDAELVNHLVSRAKLMIDHEVIDVRSENGFDMSMSAEEIKHDYLEELLDNADDEGNISENGVVRGSFAQAWENRVAYRRYLEELQ